ncbi:MAG: hypothetical protein FJX67_19695, partial [Alphaproteobacteria bacterium]|nr:hypothetical protein [Alphaproteobacteria bacterium]
MDVLALARQFVCRLIAATLGTTVSIVEKLLPSRPDWVERIDVLAGQLRAAGAAAGAADGAAKKAGDNDPVPSADTARLLAAYETLWAFVQSLQVRGVGFDEKFCDRIKRDWTLPTLISYLRAVDVGLQRDAAKAQLEAAALLAGTPPPEAPTAEAAA